MPNLNYRAWWLTLGWLLVALVIYLSLMPQPPQPLDFDNGDKLEHASAYALLMTWFCQIYWSRGHRERLAVALVFIGVTLEILQGLTGYRTFDYADMLANTIGVVGGWTISLTRIKELLVSLDRRIAAGA